MNESQNKRTVVVGLFVFVGLLFLTGGILMVGDLHETFKNKMQLVSLFDDVSGLQKGNNIWFSGVKIGTVSNIDFYGKSQVEISMKIDTKAQHYIRKNAKVKISSDGLIGNKILVIYGGTDIAQVVEEGDTLEVEKTFSSEDMINTLQENNKNVLAITSDFKIISKNLLAGEGTVGKMLTDTSVYTNIDAATVSLQLATEKAHQLISSLATVASDMNKKGTLINELTTDTLLFKSIKTSVLQLQQIADTASDVVANLRQAGLNPNTTVGVLLHDEESGKRLKEIIKNLESSSVKLDEDLEAAQHNFLLRSYFKKQAKSAKKDPKTE
ncbi:MAG: putative ABC transport system substrate-binding protein [Bacteroidetes bacterium]|nr:MAG: putative ABC transport system substrate-binding protein [Bacteroidota bacterium]